DLIGGYGVFTRQGSVQQETIGIDYTHNLSDSADYAISIGLSYRFRDALIPNIGLKFGKNRIGFHYEYSLGISGFSAYRRTGVEFSYRLIL
ncbi:MAG TPA: type IX secretion system membrane protein PorP/SprF, partial [Flavitalea sp.]|nr:type IX secretion system membrane protein PorP/SprF [Flavitalea sp.]